MKIILLGDKGYVGSKFYKFFIKNNIEIISLNRNNFDFLNQNKLYKVIKDLQPKYIINAAGYTGKPNVDACENNKIECWQGNVTLPKIVSEVSNHLKIKYIQLSSGCIYTGSKNEHGFTEQDKPNFCFDQQPCSYYSGTKAVAEDIIIHDPYAYICRLRIPFNHEKDTKNYITKLLNYDTLLDCTNSLSNIDEFIQACVYLLQNDCETGIYNITNTGSIDTFSITKLLNKYITRKKFNFFSNEKDFYSTVAIAPRSNCVLDNSKIRKTGFKISSIEDALECSIKKY